MENKEFKIIKLGEFSHSGNNYIAFFNEASLSIDYYYLSSRYGDVECWSMNFYNAKKILPKIKTFKMFIENYRLLWMMSHISKKYVRLFFLQTFPYKMWEDCVLKDFDGVSIKIEQLTEEQIKKMIEDREEYEAYELQKLMIYSMLQTLSNLSN